MTLKSYLLQEAEAVSREAKLRYMEQFDSNTRVVSLQHDGIAIAGVPSVPGHEGYYERCLATGLTEWASQAAGYPVPVEVARVEVSGLIVD